MLRYSLTMDTPESRWADATLTLSPGSWMELPNFPLAEYLQRTTDPAWLQRSRLGTPAEVAAEMAQSRQPRRTVASYYEAAASFFGVEQHHRQTRAVAVRWRPTSSSAAGSAAAADARARTTRADAVAAGANGSEALASSAASSASAAPWEVELGDEGRERVHLGEERAPGSLHRGREELDLNVKRGPSREEAHHVRDPAGAGERGYP